MTEEQREGVQQTTGGKGAGGRIQEEQVQTGRGFPTEAAGAKQEVQREES